MMSMTSCGDALEKKETPEPLPPALFEALVDGWVQLLLADLTLDEAPAKLQDRVDEPRDATAS
jgi:hypothetical protein